MMMISLNKQHLPEKMGTFERSDVNGNQKQTKNSDK